MLTDSVEEFSPFHEIHHDLDARVYWVEVHIMDFHYVRMIHCLLDQEFILNRP